MYANETLSKNKHGNITKILNELLINEFTLYIKLGYYRSLTSEPNLLALKKKFEELSKDFIEAIDTIGKQIRSCGQKAYPTLARHLNYMDLENRQDQQNITSQEIIFDVLADIENLIQNLEGHIEVSKDNKDYEDIQILLDGLLTTHYKQVIMLQGYLEKESLDSLTEFMSTYCLL